MPYLKSIINYSFNNTMHPNLRACDWLLMLCSAPFPLEQFSLRAKAASAGSDVCCLWWAVT